MASAAYSEDNNIQEPAAKLFEDNLDWRSVFAFNTETFGAGSLLGRKDATEVVLTRELDAALSKLNPKLAATPEGRAKLALARDQLLDADPTKTLLQHNEAKWRLMCDGITLKSPGGNAAEDVHVTVIDFHNQKRQENYSMDTSWL